MISNKITGVTFAVKNFINSNPTNKQFTEFEFLQMLMDVINNNNEIIPVKLKPEPNNQYDPNAIAVYIKLPNNEVIRFGYLTKESAIELHKIKNNVNFNQIYQLKTHTHEPKGNALEWFSFE